jgi:hypothetical protein
MKALCPGLVFEIEFGVVEGMGQVDGNVPEGWRFDMFVDQRRCGPSTRGNT